MEQIIVVINALTFILFTASLGVVIARIKGGHLPVDTGILLSLMVFSLMFINCSNVLEHLGVTALFDYYEDFFDILVPLLFIIFLDSIRLHGDIERRAANERDLGAMLEERNELLKEIHHRVKNNLQLVISLISLQRRHQPLDEKLEQVLQLTENRIFSMAAVHETVYQSRSYTSIPAGGFIRSIASQTFQNVKGARRGMIGMVYEIDDGVAIRLETAVPLGLLVNELVSNAFRHAFVGREQGTVSLRVLRDGAMILLEVKDDGIGMPAAENGGNTNGATLGSVLISNLVDQIRGTMDTAVGGGTKITITFPR